MDTTSLKLLAQAVQKMAWTPDAVRSNLRALRSRGILPEITTRCFAGEEDENACCNPESDVPDEDEDGDGNDGTIDGERPDDGENEKGMDGRYRGPDGELVPWEAATGCVPDETWEDGYYVDLTNQVSETPTSNAAPSAGTLCKSLYQGQLIFSGVEMGPDRGNCVYTYPPGPFEGNIHKVRFYKIFCTSSEYTTGTCTTSAPCEEDDSDWPSDGKCQEALINGKFIPHPKDPDCASQAPKDNQIMCQGEGEARRCIAYIPMKDGGHMRVDVDPATRLPTSDSVVEYWGSDAKFDHSESYYHRNVQNKAYSPDSIPGTWN
ncbi:hypothetical protein [Marinobacterium stanieri]|uniref:hypothetical protein n=1 Tax=Marinobacterium stanieri TaxID=49186 RepID=UPI003A940B54